MKTVSLYGRNLHVSLSFLLTALLLLFANGCSNENDDLIAPTNDSEDSYSAPDYFFASDAGYAFEMDCLRTFYISENGDDRNSGDSMQSPWRSLGKAESVDFTPGDCVLLERGSNFAGSFEIYDAGTLDNPIYIGAYGQGPDPVIDGENEEIAVNIGTDYIVLENVFVTNAFDTGVNIEPTADNNVINQIEVSNSGSGVSIHGQYNVVSRSRFHDLTMVINDPGGDDDYGAVGIWFFGDNNEAYYNTMYGLVADSLDYGTDGGAFEWYGDASNNYVHHNWVKNCNGFMELGGGRIRNNTVSYNVSIDSYHMICSHLSGKFEATIENIEVKNNTIIYTQESPLYAVVDFDADPSSDTLVFTHNIVWIDKPDVVATHSTFSHDYNIYNLVDTDAELGFELSDHEYLSDPGFLDFENDDYRVDQASIAAQQGIGAFN